jgi:hypothetical protein
MSRLDGAAARLHSLRGGADHPRMRRAAALGMTRRRTRMQQLDHGKGFFGFRIGAPGQR